MAIATYKSKLSEQGISHFLVPVLVFILLFGVVGGYFMLRTGHAAASGTYVFRSGIAGKCLDVWHDGAANGTVVDSFACNNSKAQAWNINGNGTIENANGSCLDNWKRGTANGNPIRVFACNASDPAQQWIVTGGIIKNPQTGKCVDVPGFSTDNGKPLELYTCNGGANQQWLAKTTDGKIWLMEAHGISQMEAAGASQQLVDKTFTNSLTYAYTTNSALSASSPIGEPTFASGSYQVIQQAFSNGTLPGRFKAVLYDNERWSYTPLNEQQDPAHYEALTGQLAHQHGLLYIASPTPDLMWSVGRPKDSYVAFLQAGYVADAARSADIVDIQGQQKEDNLPYYTWFVTAAAKQAREANPRVRVIIGIRTDPGDTALYNAYKVANDVGDGFWLNINGQPSPAVYLLQHINPTQ
jgi:hypothetical protein